MRFDFVDGFWIEACILLSLRAVFRSAREPGLAYGRRCAGLDARPQTARFFRRASRLSALEFSEEEGVSAIRLTRFGGVDDLHFDITAAAD